MMTTEEILLKSQKQQEHAERILNDFPILKILEKYGQVEFTGSYLYKLMLKGDIDLHVTVSELSWEKARTVFDEFVSSRRFTACQFTNFWDANKENERHRIKNGFPKGFYIGLRDYFKTDENWKVDIWLVSEDKPDKYKKALSSLTEEQRTEILIRKHERDVKRLKTPSNEIYDKVLRKYP